MQPAYLHNLKLNLTRVCFIIAFIIFRLWYWLKRNIVIIRNKRQNQTI